VRAKRAPDSRFAREARPWQRAAAESSRGPHNKREQQGIMLGGIEIPKIFRRARIARGASRPLLAGR
jgi:hypothetical protein